MHYDAYEERQKIARLTAERKVGGLSYPQAKALRARKRNLAAMTGMGLYTIERQAEADARILIDENL